MFVYRFYTSFQITSPMSWGAWILIVVYPISIMQILSTFSSGYGVLASLCRRLAIGRAVLDWCERYRYEIAMRCNPVRRALGIYTGILLSAFGARPFWNSGVLGPLFLVSGMSTAAALVALIARQKS